MKSFEQKRNIIVFCKRAAQHTLNIHLRQKDIWLESGVEQNLNCIGLCNKITHKMPSAYFYINMVYLLSNSFLYFVVLCNLQNGAQQFNTALHNFVKPFLFGVIYIYIYIKRYAMINKFCKNHYLAVCVINFQNNLSVFHKLYHLVEIVYTLAVQLKFILIKLW